MISFSTSLFLMDRFSPTKAKQMKRLINSLVRSSDYTDIFMYFVADWFDGKYKFFTIKRSTIRGTVVNFLSASILEPFLFPSDVLTERLCSTSRRNSGRLKAQISGFTENWSNSPLFSSCYVVELMLRKGLPYTTLNPIINFLNWAIYAIGCVGASTPSVIFIHKFIPASGKCQITLSY